jgi:hypothetical protein
MSVGISHHLIERLPYGGLCIGSVEVMETFVELAGM